MTNTKRRISFVALSLATILGIYYFINAYMPGDNQAKPLKPFHLQATNGLTFNEKSLQGKWTLLFFGYMKCPDICPQTLATVRDTWNLLDNNPAPLAQFVFIDISPNEENNAQLKDFLHNYNPSFIGAVGSSAEVKELSSQLGIFQQNVGNKIDHTAALILIDPKGRMNAVLTPPFNADGLAEELKTLILKS